MPPARLRRTGGRPADAASCRARWAAGILCGVLSLAVVPPVAAHVASASAATDDRRAIADLLDAYSMAVTRKDRAAFETLLLSPDIPFSYVPTAPAGSDAAAWRNYDDFRRGVFKGPAFTQRFRDVTIRQHGALADVDLVYVNTDAHGSHAGWKTMQLLKVDGRWRVASEFFTDLPRP
jgi:hypothetical protein